LVTLEFATDFSREKFVYKEGDVFREEVKRDFFSHMKMEEGNRMICIKT
jgi:hypothetical protein